MHFHRLLLFLGLSCSWTSTFALYSVCPDGNNTCSNSSTCCQIGNGKYGCCPLSNAKCCDDLQYCCREGYHCSGDGCVSDIIEKKTLILRNDKNIDCPCPPGTTFCNNSYSCCPFPDANCCNVDSGLCCPKGFECDLVNMKCTEQLADQYGIPEIKAGIVKPLASNFALNGNVICNSTLFCPGGNTCCPNGDWGCCPFVNAICCEDILHCCPNGYKCNGDRCQADTKSPSKSKPMMKQISPKKLRKIAKAKSIVCPDSSTCPDDTTCCQMAHGYGCCPYFQAACCDDFIHCCPHNNICFFGTICLGKENRTISSSKKMISATRSPKKQKLKWIVCPDHVSMCPNGDTCCLMNNNKWGCCPTAQATCCDDRVHCCPNGTQCQTGHCVREGYSVPWIKKNKAASIYDNNEG